MKCGSCITDAALIDGQCISTMNAEIIRETAIKSKLIIEISIKYNIISAEIKSTNGNITSENNLIIKYKIFNKKSINKIKFQTKHLL